MFSSILLQVNAAAVTFAFNWGSLTQTYLDTQDSLSSIGTSYFELACFGEGDASEKTMFVAETIIYILLPLVLIALTGTGVLLSAFFKSGKEPGDDILHKAKVSAVGVASITLFLLQPTLVKQFALLFSCIRMGTNDNDVFFLEDLRIRCYSKDHIQRLFGLGLPLLGLYVIGIPLAMYKLLSHPTSLGMIRDITQADQMERKAKIDDLESIRAASAARTHLDAPTQAFKNSYAFLFLGYRPELYLWEIAVLARKGGLSLIGVAFSTDPRMQVMLGLLVIFVCAVAHARFMPFDDALMNTYEFISLSASAMTFFIGVFTMDNEDDTTTELASALAFVVNMLFVVSAVPIGLRVKKIASRSKNIQKVQNLLA